MEKTAENVNYFIYAKDFSGSTNHVAYYHDNGLKTLKQFQSDVEKIKKELVDAGESPAESKIVYLHWGNECVEVDEDTTISTYLEHRGDSCDTNPKTIIDWLKEKYDKDNISGKNSKFKLLYIITDGLIYHSRVQECFDANENMNYETVVFHAFNSHVRSIDLSVASSFFKNRCIVYSNAELHDSVDISDEFDYDKINVGNFDSEKDNLKSYIKLKFLASSKTNTRALEEIEKLKKLRARLFNELPPKTQEEREVNLETKDRNVFIQEFARTNWYKNLTPKNNDENADTTQTITRTYIERIITTMINYLVSEQKSYAFDALKFDKEFDESVEHEPILNVNFPVEQEIEFPDIILDDEKGVPVVILFELDLFDKIIFHGRQAGRRRMRKVPPASFRKFKSTMECPLFLMSDKNVSESVGYFYTYNVYKQFLENNTKTEPRTRKPFRGGIVLTDMDQFDKYNDYILAATYFNGKKVNFNVGLFYYVLWKNCENKQWMDRNVVEQFKRYALRRISGAVCKIGLSSLPLEPREKTSLLTALWYCVDLSSCIFKEDPEHFTRERLRMFHGVAHCMIEILQYFAYDLDLKSIKTRSKLMSHVMNVKKIQKHTEKVHYLLTKIFKTVDGFLVSEIEKPFNLYKLNYLKLNHKKVMKEDVMEQTVHLNDYVHLMHFEDLEVDEGTFEICENTFRPLFAIDQNKSFYTELVKKCKKVVISNDDDKDKVKLSFEPIDSLEFNKTLSTYNLFIHCTKDLERYPDLPEFVEYILQKKKFYGRKVTIFPSNVYSHIKKVYDRYQKIVTKVEVKKFIEVCQTYASRTERIKAEGRVKFNSDDEIKEFMTNEELKVKLKKIT